MKNQRDPNRFNSNSPRKTVHQEKGVLPRGNWRWVFSGCVLLIGSLLALVLHKQHQQSLANIFEPLATAPPLSLTELASQPDVKLERIDIAMMNLWCAQGLTAAGEINIPEQSATLDLWAKRVQTETERHLYRFRANPQEYHSSEAYFRMLMMAVVLYEDFNIRYNPARISRPENLNLNDHFFADSQDIFVHGLLGSRRMGTCSSMPVLYAALGRRLGYPLKLVTTKAHLFLRWEDAKERFNLEATGQGMNRYDDEHFKRWPFPVSEEEIRTEGYLKSLTAAEELAVFLSLRANCLKEAGQPNEAAICYAQAARLAPHSRAYALLLAEVQQPRVPAPLPSTPVGEDLNPLRKWNAQ